jgi:hypothetical protein
MDHLSHESDEGGLITVTAMPPAPDVAATVRLPFLHIGIARADPACATDAGDWGWSLFRVTAWKTEFRLDIPPCQ